MGPGWVTLNYLRVPVCASVLPLNEEEARDKAGTGLTKRLSFSILWHRQGKLGGLVSARRIW